MIDLADTISITQLTSTVVTDTCFEMLDVIGVAKKGAANPPIEGKVLFNGVEMSISSYNIGLESGDITVQYWLNPSFYNEVVTDTDFSKMARVWGLDFKNVGAVDVVLWNGMPASLLFNAFHAQCVRRNIERQFIVSTTEKLLFFGNPASYPLKELDYNLGDDMAFRGMYGKPGYWDNFRGNQYSVDEGDENQTVMAASLFPPIGKKFCEIELTADVLTWGVRYNFSTMPLMSGRKFYVYSKQTMSNLTKYVLCEL